MFRTHLLVASTLLAWLVAQPSRAADKPNFLVIVTDDQSPETLKAYGNSICFTPTLDRLAAEGMVLDDAHHMGSWSGAVCTPSRTMIMTGRTLWRIPGAKGPGINQPRSFRAEAAMESMPAVFRRAGYATFRTCKKGNSYPQANAQFEIRKEATRRRGNPENGSPWHADQVVDYLQERKSQKDERPFLIYLGFSHPHDPRNAPEELAAKYGADNQGPPSEPNSKAPPLPNNYLPAHPFPHGHPRLRDEVNVQGVKKRRDPATIRNELGREYACIESIDQQIGRVLKRLQANGELDDTYILFTADHGIAVGRHGLTGKQNLYEHTWQVPMIIRGPGIKPGSRASGFVYLLDIFPTLCDLAEIATPDVVEGKSFRPVLEGKKERIRDIVYGVYCGGTKPGMRAVKTSEGWKLIKVEVLDGKVNETQLFNLNDNPREWLSQHHTPELRELLSIDPKPQQVDLAEDPTYARRRKQLEDLLSQQMRKYGDPYTLTNPE